MSDRAFRGVWIPAEIWLSRDLSVLEKCLLAEIDSLDNGAKGCFASNAHFVDFLGCSLPTVSRGVKTLASKGLIKVTSKRTPTGEERTIKSLIKMITPPNQNDSPPHNQNDEHSILLPLGDSTSSPVSKKTKHKHGEFGHVLLTDSDLENFKAKFPLDWEQRINDMDRGIEKKGYKYKNFYLALLDWAKREQGKSTPLFDAQPSTAMSDRDARMLALAQRR